VVTPCERYRPIDGGLVVFGDALEEPAVRVPAVVDQLLDRDTVRRGALL